MATFYPTRSGTIFRVTTQPAGIGPHYMSANKEDTDKSRTLAAEICRAMPEKGSWAGSGESSDAVVFTGELGKEIYATLALLQGKDDKKAYNHLVKQLCDRAAFEILA